MIHEMNKIFSVTGNGLKFIILLIFRSPVSFLLTAINAVFLQQAFNAVEQNNTERLTAVCFAFLVAILCIFLYNGTVWSIYAPFTSRLSGKLSMKLFDKISKFSCERIEKTSHGDWMTRLNIDVQLPFSQPLHFPHAVNAILQVVISAIMLWVINTAVFGWVIIFVVPHIVVSQIFVARVMPKLNKKFLEATANNTSELTAIITCADITALYDGQDYLMKRFEKSSLEMRRAKMKICAKNALNGAITVLALSGYIVLLIVSVRGIANEYLTFGDLTAAFQYRLGIIIGTNMFINCIISIQASMTGIRRINEVMSEKTEEANG